ncbi:MAG: hypothetical protein IPH21_18570 [Flavobacteriales bacterium]|nr:hypothetical protein [Flavobacteriales bacterium]
MEHAPCDAQHLYSPVRAGRKRAALLASLGKTNVTVAGDTRLIALQKLQRMILPSPLRRHGRETIRFWSVVARGRG